jgi:phosphatidylglycerophosphatase A
MVAATAGIVFAVGIWTAGEAEEFFGSKDPGPVVIDEIAGQIITLLARPDASWRWLLAGFVLFRLMDVVKPFPARRAEHLPGGWGIMTDDVAAGLYSLGGLLLLRFVIK